MKILVLTMWYPYDENPLLGTFVEEQVRAIAALGQEIRVVQPLPSAPFPLSRFSRRYRLIAGAPATESRHGIPVYHPRYLTLPRHICYEQAGRWMYLGARRTLDAIRHAWHFDVIHAHETFPPGFVANRYRDDDAPNVRVVQTIHGTSIRDAPTYNRRCFDRVGESLRKADARCFVSAEGRMRAGTLYGRWASESSDYVTNGVNPEKFALAPADRGAVEDLARRYPRAEALNLLFVGNLLPAKGVLELLEATRRLLASDGPRVRLLLVGPNYMQKEIRRFVDGAGIADSVEVVGPVPHSSVKHWMSFCDIFILPSHFEGVPTVLFEALYLGKPSVFTRVGGIPNVITESEAMLIEPRSVDTIVKAVSVLLADPDLRARLASNGQRLIAREYTWQRNAQRMVQVYERVLAR